MAEPFRPSERTPADLRALRIMCGLSVSEASSIVKVPMATYERLERGKQLGVFADAFAPLRRIEEAVAELASPPHPWPDGGPAVGYMNDEDLRRYDPKAAELVKFNSAHRMALAIAQSYTGVPIVEIVPALYNRYLEDGGVEDSPENRWSWARYRLVDFRLKKGLPTPKTTEEEFNVR